MADLKSFLSSCGLLQYHERFVEAGFDTWETLQDITESDLEFLDVQRGHRRRLQQEIAHTLSSGENDHRQRSRAPHQSPSTETKRQYTHHPKPDPNAPQRPLSAYVLFSNTVRAELKDQSLSFAEKSKIVGDRWQSMSDSARDSWKQATHGPWEKYKADKLKYQDSDLYRQYQEYLAEFNGLQTSKKRKVLSNDFLHDADEVQTRQAPSSESRQTINHQHIAPTPGSAPPNSTNVSPSTSTPDRQRSLMSDFGGSTSSAPSLPTKNLQRYELSQIQSGVCLRRWNKRPGEKVLLLVTAVDKLDSPQAEEVKSMSSGHASRTIPDETKEDSSEDSGGEDDASNVGSMGSTDHLDEASFAGESGGGRIDAFLGQTATDNWVERIKHNLKISDADELRTGHGSSGDHKVYTRRQGEEGPGTAADMNRTSHVRTPMFQEHFEPYELPLKATADSFIAAYFATVHPVFPIVSRSQFLWNYEKFFASTETAESSASLFVPILHIVLAIGGVHTYVTHAPWASDGRSRLMRFARAKATILDACVLGASAYEQVQLCGLGGLYMLIMYDINK
ncbi:MAG: hypothetical protein Q9209_005176 [Squamulea sp. 1 TL-2023]